MHWFWMVLVCVLLLFAYWKLRRFCRCPGPSKEERKDKRQARWNKRQLEEIEEKIDRNERKLEDIRSLRNYLGLGPGANSSALEFSSIVDQSSHAWRSSWPVRIYPSQAAATWWRSPAREQTLTYSG